ncbi:invasion associated locus B family protein [Hansschlegelia beijingensis]|uniref:Invasion associated locus B family protein n=1 Tax=Hansschlegelia beijingensis TaxID=1133344 RepID=A0A7W6GGT3_9HYPH|nr:invasion associated locus B family protein [Hansschlegelia beijingensis]MBB3973069.1 hypothetical protein [Hansschlegelia beijingensis]
MTDRLRPALLLAAGLAVCGVGGALAQGAPAGVQPTLLGEFKDWNAYAAPVKGGKVCYALATPEKGRRRSANPPAGAYFFISNRPQDGVVNEVSVMPGFALKPDSQVELDVDDAKFTLFVRGDGAFMSSNEEQQALVKAMREGRKDMTVKAVPARGRQATQSYSLAGISAALDKINAECRPTALKAR